MIRLGIIGCSEIAFRRFMPAVKAVSDIQVVAVAEEYDATKLAPFCEEYGLEGMNSFEELIRRTDIDAVYVPQPPALHYKWAKMALENGKHVLIEKPSTTSYVQSKELVDLAKKQGVALHENYMFQYHAQIAEIQRIIESGEIGELRLIRANFGFPLRAQNDFRYVASLGGGAVMDAAGYPIKLATILLGDTAKVDTAHVNGLDGYEVDMFGSVTMSNDDGVVCQIGYGMDCGYQCNLEVWGSKGRLFVDRVFTAPPEFKPVLNVICGNETRNVDVEPDNHFTHSIEAFVNEVHSTDAREKMYDSIVLQAKLVESVKNS